MVQVAVAVRWVGVLRVMEIMWAVPVGVRWGREGGGGGIGGRVTLGVGLGVVGSLVLEFLLSLSLSLLVLLVRREVVEEKAR